MAPKANYECCYNQFDSSPHPSQYPVSAGQEVAQLYLGMPAETSEPPKQLKGFQKLSLEPGETKTVTFTLAPADYSFWSAGLNQWMAYPGEYQVMVGSSSRAVHQSATFTVDNRFFVNVTD